MGSMSNGVDTSKRNFFWNNGFASVDPWYRLKPKRKSSGFQASNKTYSLKR